MRWCKSVTCTSFHVSIPNPCEHLPTLADFDNDDMISAADLKELIDRLTGEEELTDDDLDQLISNVSSDYNRTPCLPGCQQTPNYNYLIKIF